jgi:hypothetical protein
MNMYDVPLYTLKAALDMLANIVGGEKFYTQELDSLLVLRESLNEVEIRLWHDDVRHPPNEEWIWAKTNADAIFMLAHFNVVECSLDHDLGAKPTGDDETDAFVVGSGEETGMDLVQWLVEHDDRMPERVRIHSMNAPAAQRMRAALFAAGTLAEVRAFDLSADRE